MTKASFARGHTTPRSARVFAAGSRRASALVEDPRDHVERQTKEQEPERGVAVVAAVRPEHGSGGDRDGRRKQQDRSQDPRGEDPLPHRVGTLAPAYGTDALRRRRALELAQRIAAAPASRRVLRRAEEDEASQVTVARRWSPDTRASRLRRGRRTAAARRARSRCGSSPVSAARRSSRSGTSRAD